jgi:hypothetical protein
MPDLAISQLAAVTYERGFDIDRLLVEVCAELAQRGVRLGGVLQVSTGARGGNCATSVRLVDLRSRCAFDIWEDRGPCARGCRLDESGLSAAEWGVRAAIEDRVDLLIINRFGRAESLGRGLRGVLEMAVAEGIPLLTAVRAPYDAAWRSFHGGLGQELPAEIAAVLCWATRAVTRSSERPLPRAL